MQTTEEKIEQAFAILCDRVAVLEKQVAELTADRDRFLNALRGAAEMALHNNVTAAMMPKDMKRVLQEYVRTNGTKA
jgi:predicted house-cleaning NTP pyrophosphatase (Maf/HAM1 superfamily)